MTGGNDGIGLGMAGGLAKAGAAVAIVGRNATKSQAAAEVLRQSGARVLTIGLLEKVETRTPAGRWGRPEDFEAITVMLSGPGSQYITGTAIMVDGGYSIQA